MSAVLGNIVASIQQAADSAKQVKEAKARRKTDDGRPIFRIACIGHANSGKTTFWTVLEASTRRHANKFNVQTGDNTTAAYLRRQVEVMESGMLSTPEIGENEQQPGSYVPGYPDETDVIIPLLFMVREPGKPELPIMVQEYPGAAIGIEDRDGRSEEVREFLRAADGVLFFIDGRITSVSQRAIDEQLAGLQALLLVLENRRGQIDRPIGLVITMADALKEYRPAVPVAVMQEADFRRRRLRFDDFLKQLLSNELYTRDGAWKERVGKVLRRISAFADALLKKCSSTQFFFVSAVGDIRSRPLRQTNAVKTDTISDSSVYGGTDPLTKFQAGGPAELVMGKANVGLDAPVRWMANELTVRRREKQVGVLRNKTVGWAVAWALFVSLPFMGYLGCATHKVQADFRMQPVSALDVLRDVHGFEENYFAGLWSFFDRRGFMATAKSVRDRAAEIVAEESHQALLVVLQDAQSAEPARTVAACAEWDSLLSQCLSQLPDSSGTYADARKHIARLERVYDGLKSAFKLEGTLEHSDALQVVYAGARWDDSIYRAIYPLTQQGAPHASISPPAAILNGASPVALTAVLWGGRPPYVITWKGPDGVIAGGERISVTKAGEYRLTVTDQIMQAFETTCVVAAADTAGKGAAAAPGAASPAVGAGVSLQLRYNALIERHGGLVKPESRLNFGLVGELKSLSEAASRQSVRLDPASLEAKRRIHNFLDHIKPFMDGIDVRIQVYPSAPARLKVTDAPGDSIYSHGSLVVIHGWRLGKRLRLQLFTQDSGGYVPISIDDLWAQEYAFIDVPGLTARGGGPVKFQYVIESPATDDVNVPPLDKVE